MPANEFKINLQSLPSPPSVAISLLELFNDPDAGLNELANIIRVDPALSARIIAHCNSAAMGMPREVDSIDRASVCLGMNSVRMIALSFSLVETSDDSGFDFPQFWNRSLAYAVASQAACRCNKHDIDFGFLTGLMMNIGEIAIYRDSNHDVYAASKEIVQSIGSIVQFENEKLGTNRFEVGGEILNEWNFPPEIPAALKRFSKGRPENRTLEMSISSGWNLASLFTNPEQTSEQVETLKTQLQTDMGFDEEKLETIFLEAQNNWLEYSAMLNLENNWCTKSIRELENSARIQMTSFSIMQVQDQQRIEKENDQLRSSATKDALTGVNNRRAYDEQGNQAFSRCRRTSTPVSMIVIDIDHFKKFNDNHGHKVGDMALKHVADLLKNSLRDYDNLYRYGGEEFVIILPENNKEQAMQIAERLRETVEKSPLKLESEELSVTISVGIATCDSPSASSLELLFESADSCLYTAKEQGRNCCVFFEPQDSIC